jgi:hypothetical protein
MNKILINFLVSEFQNVISTQSYISQKVFIRITNLQVFSMEPP